MTPADISEDWMPDIKRLVSECRKHFEILIPRTQTPLIVRTQTPLITRTQTPLIIRTQTPVYTNDRLKDLAKGWERPYELFKGCLVLVEPTSGFKSYIEIEGGFDRYPKTASLLEGHLQDLILLPAPGYAACWIFALLGSSPPGQKRLSLGVAP